MKYRAVLFDFDYTLGDATESIYEGFCYGFAQMGHPQPDREAVRRTVGYMLEDAFTLLTGETSPARQEEFRNWFVGKVHATQAEKTHLFPGAAELLTTLHRQGIRLGIVSSKRSGVLKTILDKQGLTELLQFTTGGDLVKLPKPDPEGLNAGIAALGVERSAVLYCGDTTIDAQTAQNAGVDFVAVLNGTTPAEDFQPYPHVHIAPDLPELQAWLGV